MDRIKDEEPKVPYTKNTADARIYLEENGYSPLRFFQGKSYICPCVSTFANKHKQWLVYDYLTFNEDEKKSYMMSFESNFEDFKSLIVRLYPKL